MAQADDRGDDFTASDEPAIEEGQEVKDEEVVEEEKVETEDTSEQGDTESEEEEGATTVETKEPHIPKSRFDKAVGKARKAQDAAEKRAEELEAKLKASQGNIDAAKVEAEIEELEDELEKALADGNTEAKKRIRKEIRAKEQSLAEARAAVHAQYAQAVAIEQVRYDAFVERMEAEHPELNPDHENYDEDVIAELQEFKEAFEAKGLSSTEALKKAVGAIYKNAKPAQEKEVEKKAEKRTEEAVKKGLEASKKSPPAAKGVPSDKAGKVTKDPDVSKMTEAEYDKLTPEQLKRLRGDIAA